MLSGGAAGKSRGEICTLIPASGSIGHNWQVWHAAELIHVVGDDSHAMHQRGGGDPHVVGSDELSFGCKRPINLAILPGDVAGPRENRIGAAQALPVFFRASRLAAGQFAGHGEGDVEALLRSAGKEAITCGRDAALGFTLGHDDEVRVEDQAHGSSGMGSCLAASSTASKYVPLTPLPPLRK